MIFDPCPPCGRQGRPGKGFLAGSISEPRGSAPRERDHRGGDHPVPSRTRQLSPPSPRVLQRKAAGGQGVALAEGAFLCARRAAASRRARARHAPRRPAGGGSPAGLSRVLGLSRGRGALCAAYLALRALGAVRWRQHGLRFLGTLRHRVGCAPDFDRHGGGAMSRVCRRVSAYMLLRAVSCLSCCWFVRSVLRSAFSVLHFLVNVFDS